MRKCLNNCYAACTYCEHFNSREQFCKLQNEKVTSMHVCNDFYCNERAFDDWYRIEKKKAVSQ